MCCPHVGFISGPDRSRAVFFSAFVLNTPRVKPLDRVDFVWLVFDQCCQDVDGVNVWRRQRPIGDGDQKGLEPGTGS